MQKVSNNLKENYEQFINYRSRCGRYLCGSVRELWSNRWLILLCRSLTVRVLNEFENISGDKQVIISHDSSNEVKNISEDVQKWNPWQRTVEIAPIESVVCQETSAIGDFPEDLFTRMLWLKGTPLCRL